MISEAQQIDSLNKLLTKAHNQIQSLESTVKHLEFMVELKEHKLLDAYKIIEDMIENQKKTDINNAMLEILK